jgi:hypothetical protein
MELKTLFKRESVADSLSIRIIQIPPNQTKFNSGVSSVPLQKSDIGWLENRFQRNCRFKNGEVIDKTKKYTQCRYQSIRPPLIQVQGGLLIGVGDGERVVRQKTSFLPKQIAQVLEEEDRRTLSLYVQYSVRDIQRHPGRDLYFF